MSRNEDSSNPYAAPQAPLTYVTDPRSWRQRIADEWQRGAWPLVFLLNLPLPGALGFALSNNAGRFGMILTTIGLLLLTAWLVAGKPLLRARLIAGGKIVAVFQILPFFHFVIGFASLWLLARLAFLATEFFEDEDQFFLTLDFLPACLLTFLVGSGLLLFALLLGVRQVSRTEKEKILAVSREDV